MKWAELIINKQKGQSLIELMIAMGVFVLVVSAISWLIIDSYLSDRAGRERMVATFLAKEGMEAARSIRDNSWDDLSAGNHGLAISGNNWIFQGSQEDVSNRLREGTRKIIVEEINPDRKKVTSQITWKLTEARSQNVSLISYLTNWGQAAPADCKTLCQWEGYDKGKCKKPDKCKGLNLGEVGECLVPEICCCE